MQKMLGFFGAGEGDPECSGQSCEDGVLANLQSSCKLFNIICMKTTAKLLRILLLSIEIIY